MAHVKISIPGASKRHDAFSDSRRYFVRERTTWLGALGVVLIVVATVFAIADAGRRFLSPQEILVIPAAAADLADSRSQQ